MAQFMKPQIEFGEWLEVDGACGIEAVPADLVYIPKWMIPDFDYDTDCMEEDSDLRNVLDSVEDFIESNVDDLASLQLIDLRNVLDSVEDFIESNIYDVTSIRLVEGYGARLSAPGYMDATAWTVFKTREDAEEFLRDTYDLDEDEDE